MPFTQRVEVGMYYTDGADLYEVAEVAPLGGVYLRNSVTGQMRFMGIDAFRRALWRAK